MKTLSVSYDLRRGEPEEYTELIMGIKKHGAYCPLTKSEWLVRTNKSAEEVGKSLIQFVDPGDKLTVKVVDLTQGWFGIGLPPEVISWLRGCAPQPGVPVTRRQLKPPMLPPSRIAIRKSLGISERR